MRTFISFFGERLRRVAAAFLIFLKVGKFYVFPSAKNLMLQLWYGFLHMKSVRADTTADSFLNDTALEMEEAMADPDLSYKKRRLYVRFLYAVADPELYSMMIAFLETPSFSAGLGAELIDKIERVRKPGLGGPKPVKEGGTEGKADATEPIGKVEEPVGGDMRASGLAEAGGRAGSVEAPGQAGAVEAGGLAGTGDEARKQRFNAKTYFIAAQLHFELKGKEAEFKTLSLRINQLAAFVKKQFHTDHLPGTFYELKEYSYKSVLLGGNESRKGQLKPCFRQLSENPAVFGKAIAQRAQKILEQFY